MLRAFCPASNTCLTPVGEFGLSLLEMKAIIGLPILGDLYEEYVPSEDEFVGMRRDSPEFAATLDALFNYHRPGCVSFQEECPPSQVAASGNPNLHTIFVQ